jgi:peptide/nickel transport system ATP-binding protein
MSLDIHRGETVGLYGPSGSGKSTLGNILLGLIRPDKGSVERANGHKPFQYFKLYQDPPASFSPFHTLKSSMNDFLALHHQSQERFDELLEKLNLDPSLLDRDPANVSGGELQRCAILRALMLDPAFLFADEPTSRLDPITQKETLDLICMTTRQLNCAMLLVSHDIEILNKSCDRVIRLS